MSWLFFALLAPAIFTVVTFIDKLILEKEVRDPLSMPIYSGITAFVAGCVLWVLTGFPVLSLGDTVLILVAGMVTGFGAAIYFKALSQEETSRIIFFIQMQPIMVLLLSLIFLREGVDGQQFMGFVLILGAALALSAGSGLKGLRPSRAFWMILCVDFLWAASIVLFKFVSESGDSARLLSYESWGLSLGGLLIYIFIPSIRRAFHSNIRTVSRRAIGMVALNETIFVIAKLATFTAVALGPVALVSVLGGAQVFMGIVVGWVLTLLLPSIYKEDIQRQTLIRKGALAAVMIVGIGLVSQLFV